MKWYQIISAIAAMTFMSSLLLKANDSTSGDSVISKYKNIKYNGKSYQVLSGKVHVRLINEVSDPKNDNILSDPSFKFIPLLTKAQSIKYDSKNAKLLSTKPNINIEAVKKAEEPLLRTYTVAFDSTKDPIEICDLLKKNNYVEIAEPIIVDHLLSGDYPPNDPYLNQQNVLSQCKILDAWEKGMTGDPNIIIGISDIGIVQAHDDLIKSIARNNGEVSQNGIDDDGNGYIDDYDGYNVSYIDDGTQPWDTYNDDNHGTMVAGMAAATTNNEIGVAGTGYKCKMFPIKAGNIHDTPITRGYESIIYAAKRGCKVLNCSWGLNKNPSSIEQSVIDYAVANDMAVVAAGGNENYISFEIYYPAGYYGVLGVGNVDSYDKIANTMVLGSQVRILAPGVNNWSCDLGLSNYTNSGSGTSFASPIVAGVLGLVRAKYPQLSAIQSIEFLRQCTDDVSDANPAYYQYLPGRLNALKAAVTDPMSIPGIKPSNIEYYVNGEKAQRLLVNQDVDIKVKTKNFLGSANNLTVKLSFVGDNNNLELINSTINIPSYPTNSELDLSGFKIRVLKSSIKRLYLRFDISGENGYKDFFLMPMIPTSEVITLSNKVLQFSVSDRGNVGFGGASNQQDGVGFCYMNYGNQLFQGGFLACIDNNTIVKSYNGYGTDGNDFTNEQSITSIKHPVGIFNDNDASTKIGLSVKQEYFIAHDSIPAYKVKVTMKNTSINTLIDLVGAYYFDWDIQPQRSKNRVRPFTEAIPDSLKNKSIMAELAYLNEGSPYIAALAYSDLYNGQVQVAGFDVSSNDVSDENLIVAMNKGGQTQTSVTADIAMLAGMKFTGNTYPTDSVSFFLVVAADTNIKNLASTLIKYRSFTEVGNNNNLDIPNSMLLLPNPVRDNLKIRIVINSNLPVKFEISDVLGKTMMTEITGASSADFFDYDMNVSNLYSGTYIIKAVSGKEVMYQKFIKE